MKRILTALAHFHATFKFDEDLVNPMNTIELEAEKGKFLREVQEHFATEWDSVVEKFREEVRLVKPPTLAGELEVAAADAEDEINPEHLEALSEVDDAEEITH